MAKKKIKIELDVDSKSLGQLEDQLEQVNQELKDVDRNSDAFKELAAKSQILNKEIEKINNTIEGFNLEDKIMAADGAAKIFGGSLSAAVGTLGALGIESEAFGAFEEKAASAIAVGLGIKDVSEGFGQVAIAAKKSGIATKLFGTTTKKALLASGIGVFVVALGTIVAYWDDITIGVKRFVNNVPFIGKAIDAVKGAFDSLFEAAKPILEFLGILPSEAERAALKVKEATSEIIKEIEREIAVSQAAGIEAKKLFDLRKRLLEEEINLLRLNAGEKEAIYKKETELLALEAAEQKRIRDFNLENQETERVKTVSSIKAQGLAKIETNIKVGDSNKELATKEEIGRRETLLQTEILEDQKIYLAGETLGQISSILGEASAAGKAAGIASATINSYVGFTEVLRSPTTIPEPFGSIQKVISAATILGSGLKTVKSILSVKTPGGGGGASAPSISSAPAFNVVGAAPENQLAQAIGEKESKPQRAYIVASDVTSQQALDRNIIESASI